MITLWNYCIHMELFFFCHFHCAYLILSLFIYCLRPPLPLTNSNSATVMHTIACCHHVRRGQFVDDANSKVTLSLQMHFWGHFKISEEVVVGKKPSMQIPLNLSPLIYLHPCNSTCLRTHSALSWKWGSTCNPKHCQTLYRRGNENFTCIVSLFECMITRPQQI